MSEVFRIFENMQEVAFVIDEHRNVHFGNAALATLLDVSPRRLSSGKALSNFIEFSPDLLEDGQDLSLVDEPSQVREVEFTTSSGKTGSVQVSIQAFPAPLQAALGPDVKRWVVYFRDVSLEKVLADKYKGELDQKEAVIEDLRRAQAELENYSKNLEKMVEARTAELREANRLLATILDSLGQGIFVFDKAGKCLPIFSKVCERMFGQVPSGKPVADVLNLQGTERETFVKWVDAIFEEMLDFQDLAPLGPSQLASGGDRHIAFDYHPMRGEAKNLQGVVLVATDKTDEMKARKEADRERSFAKRVVQIVQHRQQFRMFAAEAARICGDLIERLDSGNGLDAEEIARSLHTVKGGAASFSLVEIAEAAHLAEDILLGHVRARRVFGSTVEEWPAEIRGRLKEGAVNMRSHLDEFLESHSFLAGGPLERTEGRMVEIPASTLAEWHRRMSDPATASKVAPEILDNWVYEPAGKAFGHVDGSIQELAASLGKKLKPLSIEGGDLRVLPEAFSDLFSTFIHAFRNAVDHGMEAPEERLANGKDPSGQIRLRFSRGGENGGRLLKAEIVDDGRGIDPQKIRARLDEKQLQYDKSASDSELIQAVFRDDFSTAQSVTTVSGRGVGLSAIKSQAEKMGGTARIESRKGEGSVLTVIVPDPCEAFDTGGAGSSPAIKLAG